MAEEFSKKMTKARNTAQTLNPRVINVDEEVAKLKDYISSFGKSEITTNFFDPEKQAQAELKKEFEGFTDIL